MVRGLGIFREYFAAHAGQFVLIGGTAATCAMESAGLGIAVDGTYDPKSLQITAATNEILARIAQAYGLNALRPAD